MPAPPTLASCRAIVVAQAVPPAFLAFGDSCHGRLLGQHFTGYTGTFQDRFPLIDLHSHTNESDGTYSPEELIEEARRAGVDVLGITDHDTFRGYDEALGPARASGVDLLCGIELSTKLHGRSVHLLGYFPNSGNGLGPFREWVLDQQASRRDRNIRLVARLQELG